MANHGGLRGVPFLLADGREGRTRRWVGPLIGIALLAASVFGTSYVVAYSGDAGKKVGESLAWVPGTDSRACVSYPCARVDVLPSGEARVKLTLGIESTENPQPMTYYTDALRLTNPTNFTVTVVSVKITTVSETVSGSAGGLFVYYCELQSDDPAKACEGSYEITGTQGGQVLIGGDQLGPGCTRFIEFAGFAGEGAHAGDSISFVFEVTATAP